MASITRRDFIHSSALMAAAPLAGSALLQAGRAAAQQTPPSEKVRLGLIGCGGIGKVDLATFLANPEVDCPVICDVDESRFAETVKIVEEARGHRPDAVKDFRRVIDRNDVDVLLVATPDHWHALPTVYGCQAGKDVYCEKPLGQSIGEGRAMMEAAKQNKRVAQMGTQWRSGKHYAEAVAYIQSGAIGPVRMVRAWAYLDWLGGIGNVPDGTPPPGVDYDMWLGPAPERPFNPNRFHFNFRWFWDYAGGLMTDWGVHLLNICLWAMGTEWPRNVYSSGGKYVLKDDSETPDTQVTVFDFPKYTLVFEHQIQGGVGIGGRPHGMSFSGSEGTVIIDGQGWEVVREPEKTLVPFKKEAEGDGRPEHVRNFLDCVKTREQPVENFEVAHFVSTVAHLGNLAFRTGRGVTWNADKGRVEDNRLATNLAGVHYRKPWKLPYA